MAGIKRELKERGRKKEWKEDFLAFLASPPASLLREKGWKEISEMLNKWDVINIRKTGRGAKDYTAEEHWSSYTSVEKRLCMRSSLRPVEVSAPPAMTDLSRHREGHCDTFHISNSQTFVKPGLCNGNKCHFLQRKYQLQLSPERPDRFSPRAIYGPA